jgi:hypothetical protein
MNDFRRVLALAVAGSGMVADLDDEFHQPKRFSQ